MEIRNINLETLSDLELAEFLAKQSEYLMITSQNVINARTELQRRLAEKEKTKSEKQL